MQFVSFTYTLTCILTCTHTCLVIILATIGCVCKHCTDSDFRIQRFENLVIAYKHRNGLHGKQGIKFSIKCGFVEIVKDEFCNFFHPGLIVIINDFIAVVVFHKETKHVFIRNGILNQIFMEAIAEYFFGGMSVHRILSKNRRSGKAEYPGIVKELHNLLVAVPEMTAMTLIKYHYDT